MKTEQHEDVLILIVRNLAGISDSDEIVRLNKWLDMSSLNKQYYQQVRNIWNTSDRSFDPGKINSSLAFEKVLKRLPAISLKRTLWSYWQKVAAIIVIPLIIGTLGWFYIYNEKTNNTGKSDDIVYNEVFTAIGTRSSLVLADSSIVWLNSGSSLRYPVNFNTNERKVFLKGEAYFEVKSDILKPFIVQTPTMEVQATGTKFSVSEYDSAPFTEVTLVSGKVSVREVGSHENLQPAEEISPNEHYVYNRTTKTKISTFGDTYRYISWKDGILIFRDEPLESVLYKISLYFNVDIELQGEELRSYRYYATFKEESLDEILKLLRISAPINYREVKRIPLPDGSFPKKKVVIWQSS